MFWDEMVINLSWMKAIGKSWTFLSLTLSDHAIINLELIPRFSDFSHAIQNFINGFLKCATIFLDILLHFRQFQFCQPQGWILSTERQQPTYFVSVLTDIDANRHYCACLSFNETIAITPSKPPDEEDMDIEANASNGIRPANNSSMQPVASMVHHSIMYAPKCLVLVSSLDYFTTFRVCDLFSPAINR